MSDEALLQAKIAALAGKINKHKQQPSAQPLPYHAPHHGSHDNRASNRWTPYSRGARGGGFPSTHKNRTLVFGGAQNYTADTAATSASVDTTTVAPVGETFVSARRPGMNQLMTRDTFAREQKQKQGPPEPSTTRTEAARLPSTARPAVSKQTREILIEGVRFQVLHDGSKMIRITDPSTASKETPKKVNISGVEFLRTKHGNLIRATVAKSTQSPLKRIPKPQCENFSKYGTCSFGPACKFTHDPTKVAVCKDFLRNGACEAGRACDLSHELTYHRVPACTHFQRGNCTNSACRYPHVHVSPAAPVCRPFATLGFCAKGPDCANRHVLECPDYSNHGHCAGREEGTCALPHVDRAATLRKAAERLAKTGSDGESDVSSDEESERASAINDVDSDVAEDDIVMTSNDDDGHPLSQQQDFIAFT